MSVRSGIVRLSGIAGPNAPCANAQEVRWDVPSTEGGITGAAIRTGTVQRVEAERDSSFGLSWRNRDAGREIGASIALPLTARGTVLGALTVHARRADAFDPRTVDLVRRLTQQVSLSLDHAAGLTEIELDRFHEFLPSLLADLGIGRARRSRVGQEPHHRAGWAW